MIPNELKSPGRPRKVDLNERSWRKERPSPETSNAESAGWRPECGVSSEQLKRGVEGDRERRDQDQGSKAE